MAPPGPQDPIRHLLASLRERAKELECLYRVDEILSDPERPFAEICLRIVEALPAGWQYPEACSARVSVEGVTCRSANFEATPWALTAPVVVGGEAAGEIAVHYTEEKPAADEGPFLKEERRLIGSIAGRIGLYLSRQKAGRPDRGQESEGDAEGRGAPEAEGWRVILEFLRRTDPDLLRRITRRMINWLGFLGIPEAEPLLHVLAQEGGGGAERSGENVPLRRVVLGDLATHGEEAFRITAASLGQEEMIAAIRGWIDEERSSFLMETLEDMHSSLSEIVESIGRHRRQIGTTAQLSGPSRRALSAALVRRLFSEELDYINVAKDFVALEDVYEVVDRIVYQSHGHGLLGGKSAGLFLAEQALKKSGGSSDLLQGIRIPRSWYVSSGALLEFLNYNNLRELYFRKYMDIEHIRLEYPRIVHVLKNSQFPPEISRGLALALDGFSDRPLIVRSSSLLEDRMGSSFAGKYKSLFLANTGSRKERLAALQDAIAEIYASVFGPDPIEYRASRGLLDVHEEMGILIQEVVGRRLGKYFLPTFSGVAMSINEFRWSPRIRREDGLVRMVPGLGTRAVDRLGDDYPVLVAPGQPALRVNVTPEEIARYSPRWMDVIDLDSSTLVTVEVRQILAECGANYPMIRDIVSIAEEGQVRRPTGLEPNFDKDDLLVTFEGVISSSPFVKRIGALLKHLSEKLARPVDIEFSCDGGDIYLLQCRAQSHAEQYAPAALPRNLPREMVLFRARKGIANGRVPELTHVVYVDPDRYVELPALRDLQDVGRAVGRLNQLLPKRRFALMGPGRWGSRGDIRMGVPVRYADISNTAVLVEVARKKGNYTPELSFGTHFFQDLVEAEIRYIPLYPEEPECRFNETFLRRARNLLPAMLPDYARLADTLRVIDVTQEKNGKILRILLNADLDEAVAIFDAPRGTGAREPAREDAAVDLPQESHSRWRMGMVERLAAEMDPDKFGVVALYLFGSVGNASAGPGSDIDLLVHIDDDPGKREALGLWLDGWSRSLAEMNYLRTGYRTEGLLDVHYVTGDDIARQTSFASKIGAVTDPARPLPLKTGNHPPP